MLTRRQRDPVAHLNYPHHNSLSQLVSSLQVDTPIEVMKIPEYVSIRNVAYNLNKQSTVLKKIKAAERDELYTVDISKNHLYIRCQAGLYEMVRRAIHVYYLNIQSQHITCDIDILREKSNQLIVQSTYKIRARGGTQAQYTINLYHTRSTILVNGRAWTSFRDSDWSGIAELINSTTDINPYLLNENFKSQFKQLAAAMSNIKGKNPNSVLPPKESNLQAIEGTQAPDFSGNEHSSPRSPITGNPQKVTSGSPATPGRMLDVHRGSSPTPSPIGRYIPIVRLQGASPGTHSSPMEHIADDTITLDQNPSKPQLTTGATVQIKHNNNQTRHHQSHPELNSMNTSPILDPGHTIRMPITNVTQEASKDRYNRSVASPSRERTSSDNQAPHLKRKEEELRMMEENLKTWQRGLEAQELDLKSRERKIVNLEKTINQRQRDLDKRQAQFETAQTVIVGLERRVNELSTTNNMLQQVIDAQTNTNQAQQANYAQHMHHNLQNNHGPTNCNDGVHQFCGQRSVGIENDRTRRLAEDLRNKEAEGRINEKMYAMETRFMAMQTQQTQQITNLILAHVMGNGITLPANQDLHQTPGLGKRNRRQRRKNKGTKAANNPTYEAGENTSTINSATSSKQPDATPDIHMGRPYPNRNSQLQEICHEPAIDTPINTDLQLNDLRMAESTGEVRAK